jgi:four helix bundle protein
MSGTYEDLKAWQSAMELVYSIYGTTHSFPRDEIYGLTNQVRRTSVSVASNIAEGKGRSSDKELLQFLNRARRSLYEVQTQLKIASHLECLDQTQSQTLLAQTNQTGRLLNGLINSFRATLEPKAQSLFTRSPSTQTESAADHTPK